MSAAHVQPGQIWADNDPRQRGRRIRVDDVREGVAICTVIAIPDDGRAARFCTRPPKSLLGFVTRIRADRFKPTSTGYRLVEY